MKYSNMLMTYIQLHIVYVTSSVTGGPLYFFGCPAEITFFAHRQKIYAQTRQDAHRVLSNIFYLYLSLLNASSLES